MIDGLTEGTPDGTLETAGAAITGLLFPPKKEAKQEREAPRPDETVEEPIERTEPEDEGEVEQPTPEEEPTEDDDEQEIVPPAPRKLKVKVDGQEIEVTEDEAVKGYSRTEDYTRKTQKLADERKAFAEHETAVRGERQQYATQLKALDELLESAAPAEPDWDTLRNEDPIAFAAAHADWELHQRRMEAVKAERRRADEKVHADKLSQLKATLEQEAVKLIEAIPAWKDAEVATKEKAEIAEYARSLSYTDEDLGAVTDHRLMLVLRDAARFRKAEKSKTAIKEKIEQARVLVPDNAPSRRNVSELTRHKQALAKTGSLHDAGAAINELLKAGKV